MHIKRGNDNDRIFVQGENFIFNENMRTATLTFYQPEQEIYIVVNALINTGTLSASVDGVEVTIENLPERIEVEYQYILEKVIASEAGTVTITFDMEIDEVE